MIRRIASIIALCLLAFGAQSQTLTNGQQLLLCNACKANPACNVPRLAGETGNVLAWYNAPRSPTALAWHISAPALAIEEAPTYTTYDSFTQGKRDSWELFLRSPRDFTRAKVRNWAVDVWGAATGGSNAEAVLLAATFSASNGQFAIGGTTRSTGTVSALDLAWPREIPAVASDGDRCQ